MQNRHLKRNVINITIENTGISNKPINDQIVTYSNVTINRSHLISEHQNNIVKSNSVVVEPKNKFVAIGRNRLIKESKPTRKLVGTQRITGELDNRQKTLIKNLQNKSVGKYLFILGNGPSLNSVDTQYLSKIDNTEMCTINVPDGRCWPTKYWAFYDISQFNMHRELYESFTGTIFNSTTIKGENPNSIKFKYLSGLGYSRDAVTGIYVGMSSVYATIQIAMYMNFDKIFVLGCDMNDKIDKSKTHFYGVNPKVKPDTRLDRFKKEANWYDRMADTLSQEERNKIVFCSKGINNWRFMDYFPTLKPDEVVKHINDITA